MPCARGTNEAASECGTTAPLAPFQSSSRPRQAPPIWANFGFDSADGAASGPLMMADAGAVSRSFGVNCTGEKYLPTLWIAST